MFVRWTLRWVAKCLEKVFCLEKANYRVDFSVPILFDHCYSPRQMTLILRKRQHLVGTAAAQP